MDLYQTLGVSRSCTREEVKEAFRARAWYAHPDRGGENETFIRICAAYKQILEDLARRPNRRVPGFAQTRHQGRPVVPPDWSWKPDLIFIDDTPPIRCPPKPADPNWKPDLVLLDTVSSVNRVSKPADPGVARKTYVSWLRQVAAESARGRSVWRSEWVGTLGTMIIFAVIVCGLWGCWIAWSYDPEKAAREARATAVRSLDAGQPRRKSLPPGRARQPSRSPAAAKDLASDEPRSDNQSPARPRRD